MIVGRKDGTVSMYDNEIELDKVNLSQFPIHMMQNNKIGYGNMVCELINQWLIISTSFCINILSKSCWMSYPGKVEGLFHNAACTITTRQPKPTYVKIWGPEIAKISIMLTKLSNSYIEVRGQSFCLCYSQIPYQADDPK